MSSEIEFSLLSHILFASQLSLGIVFLLSAWAKLRSPLTFAQNVAEYRIVPAGVAHGLAAVLIPLEAFLAIAFLTGRLTNVVLPLAAAMLSLFFIAVAINLKKGRRIACGCFGDAGEQISLRTLARLFLLLATVLLLVILKASMETRLPGLSQMILDGSTLIYLMQTAFLAVFLILMTNWLLNVPEIAFLVRHGHRSQLSSDNTSAPDGVEDT